MFLAAFSIRKLIDSENLSDECLAYKVPAEKFRATGAKRPDSMNWHHFDEHFDTGAPVPCGLTTRDLCNLLIHSFQFLFVFSDEGAICGFMVSSDRLRAKWLHMVGLSEAIQWVRYVATDDIDYSEMRRTRKGDIKWIRSRRWEEAAREMYQYLGGGLLMGRRTRMNLSRMSQRQFAGGAEPHSRSTKNGGLGLAAGC